MSYHHVESRPVRQLHRAPPKLLLAIIAIAATVYPSANNSYLATAQNVAGKFASRPKILETSSSKKRKNQKNNDEDGEYTTQWGSFLNSLEGWGSFLFYENGMSWLGSFSWSVVPESSNYNVGSAWKRKERRRKGSGHVVVDSSWKRDLFAAEFHMIVLSIIVSAVIAVLSWLWYVATNHKPQSRKKYQQGEGGAEDIICENLEQTHSGFFKSVAVGFEDITMTLKQKKKKGDGNGDTKRLILDGSIRGVANPGRMLAIMGPSGSGKSTLLHAISGQLKQDKKISLFGKRYINGVPLTGDSKIPSAFIEQEVNFFPHMTVKETLDFRVELKMGSCLKTKEERDRLVSDLMNQLGLTKSANTIVGNAKVRGLSGGERKRLSIACEMISSPPVIFLDEPTSGLDSYQATQVIETLRKLADQGKTVVAVIHQPSQHTFQLFDDLLLISEGKLMYYGERSKVREYMEGLGYGCETEVGTAEHILDCVSRVVGADAEAERESVNRIEKIARAADQHAREWVSFNSDEKDVEKTGGRKMKHIVDLTATHPGTNLLRQFKLLFRRSIQETLRGKAAIVIKIVQQVSLGLIYGGIYSLGDNQASIMDRFGLLSLIVIGATNMAMAGTIRSFPKEKSIVSVELASSLYRTFPYFISKAVSELPLIGVFNAIFSSLIYPLARLQKGKFKTFLGLTSLHSIASEAVGLLIGSISPSSDVALALFPPIIVLNIIFDGKNISEENTPALLRWVNQIGLIRWGFTGLAVNEFQGLAFNTSGPRRGPVVKTGEEALARFGLDGKSIEDVIGAQTKIIAGCWFLSFLGLALTRQKYEVMQNPPK